MMAVEGDRTVSGHLHQASVGTWFARGICPASGRRLQRSSHQGLGSKANKARARRPPQISRRGRHRGDRPRSNEPRVPAKAEKAIQPYRRLVRMTYVRLLGGLLPNCPLAPPLAQRTKRASLDDAGLAPDSEEYTRTVSKRAYAALIIQLKRNRKSKVYKVSQPS